MIREQSGDERPGRAMSFGEELRRYRARSGLSQDELAERAGLSAKAVGSLERGERQHPHPRTVDLLAAALGLDGEGRRAFVATSRGILALPPVQPVPKHNLPLQLTSFVGREAEIAAIRARLRTTRLLTLTGTGGCGKTRLALQVAAGLVEVYAEGVWVVELATTTDPALLPRAIAATLEVREDATAPLRETLLAHLRTGPRLLVLDNCEHLVAACATLAIAMLHCCPDLSILATSREVLGVGGEVAWRVPS
jgi:transcriptional regulator with XRE-family HTH domain